MRKTIEPQLTKQIVHTVPLYILLAEESRSWLIDFKGALGTFMFCTYFFVEVLDFVLTPIGVDACGY